MPPSDTVRNGRLAVLVGVALFAAYVAAQRGRVVSYDGTIMVNVATRLLTKHTVTLGPGVDTMHLQGRYSFYSFGTSLLALPFDALQRAVHAQGQSLLTLANPSALAASGALLYLIGRRLGWRPWVAVATALAYGLVTPALWQSTEMFSEPGVTLGALLLVYGVLAWSAHARSGPLLVGTGAAIAVLFRTDSLVLVAPLALAAPFLVPRRELLAREALVALAAPLVVVAAFQLWYDQHRFGSVFSTGLQQESGRLGFNTPILQGLDLLLRSPGRGFFWTSPALLIAIPGFVLLARRCLPIAIAIGAVVVARFLFFAHWRVPAGGIGWGPRLLFPATALLAIPAGCAVERVAQWRSTRRRRSAWLALSGLVGVGALVSVLSIAVPYEQYWRQWTTTDVAPSLRGPARVHAYYWSLRHNPIVGNIHLLRAGVTLAPIHFRHSPDAIGVATVTISVLTGVCAFVYARPVRVTCHPRGRAAS